MCLLEWLERAGARFSDRMYTLPHSPDSNKEPKPRAWKGVWDNPATGAVKKLGWMLRRSHTWAMGC